MIFDQKVNSRGAKDILAIMVNEGGSPMKIAEEKGLIQQNNTEALVPIVKAVIDANEKLVADYKAGKEVVLQALVGMVMKETKGSANPGLTMQILKELLS
jgi:aspartyl-tRNA(Asn)/glutamyl-tRNA(Gln) amidotransferase subunit B